MSTKDPNIELRIGAKGKTKKDFDSLDRQLDKSLDRFEKLGASADKVQAQSSRFSKKYVKAKQEEKKMLDMISGKSLRDYTKKLFEEARATDRSTQAIKKRSKAVKGAVDVEKEWAHLKEIQARREKSGAAAKSRAALDAHPGDFYDHYKTPERNLEESIKRQRDYDKQMEKTGKTTEKTARRVSILNTRLGDFFIIMSGIAASMFVFQKLHQWIRDTARVTMRAEEAMAGLKSEISATSTEIRFITDTSKFAGFGGHMSIEKAIEKMQAYIQEGYTAIQATQLVSAEVNKLETLYDGTLSGAANELKGVFTEIATVIGKAITPEVRAWANYFNNIREEKFRDKEKMLLEGISDLKSGKPSRHIEHYGPNPKTLKDLIDDLGVLNYQRQMQLHGVGSDHWDTGKPGADIRYWDAKGKESKTLGDKWKKIYKDKVQFYGMTDRERETEIHSRLYKKFEKFFKDDQKKLEQLLKWDTVTRAEIWLKYYNYPKDAGSDHEKRRLKASGADVKGTKGWDVGAHETAENMRKFREKRAKEILKAGKASMSKDHHITAAMYGSGYAVDGFFNPTDHERRRLGLDKPQYTVADQDRDLERITKKNNRTAEKVLKESRIWTDGAKRAFQGYADEATNAAQNVENVITNGFQNMEDSLVNFVTTGKLNFRNLVDGMLADLARLAIRQSIIGPLAGAFNTWMGPPSTGKASGGTVDPYSAYVVGEKGPEILQMGGSGGNIISNNKIGPAPPVTVNVHNNTEQQTKVRQEAPQFNGQEWVVNVWLDAFTRNAYGLRDSLGG